MSNLRIELLEQKVTVLQRELQSTQKELKDTQKEITEVFQEMERAFRSFSAMSTSGLTSLDARLSKLEGAPAIRIENDADVPASGVEL